MWAFGSTRRVGERVHALRAEPAPTTQQVVCRASRTFSPLGDPACREAGVALVLMSRLLLSVDLLLRRWSGGPFFAGRIESSHAHQRHSQVTYPAQYAVQRGLIHEVPREDGLSVLQVGDLQPVEPLRPARVEVSLDADFVGRDLVLLPRAREPGSQRTGHSLP